LTNHIDAYSLQDMYVL